MSSLLATAGPRLAVEAVLSEHEHGLVLRRILPHKPLVVVVVVVVVVCGGGGVWWWWCVVVVVVEVVVVVVAA